MSTVNAQNKTQFGMNRNDFYEYKKNRTVEMVKAGAGISDIAVDLGLGEKDVYSFISRNFGGLRNLKAMVNAGMTIPTMQNSVLAAPQKRKSSASTKTVKSAKSNAGQKKTTQKIYKSPNKSKTNSNGNLSKEKQKVIDEFKNSVDKDIQKTVSDVMNTLDNIKKDIMTKFKSELMNELSAMVASL